MAQKDTKIALFSNTFGLYDAMGKHTHLIKKVFPQTQIFLERGSGDPKIKTHNFYFVKKYPFMSLYMLEWKLGINLKFLEFLISPCEKLAFKHEASKLQNFDVIWLEWGLYHKAIHLFPYLERLSKPPKLIFDYHGITPPRYIKSRGKKLIAQKTIAVTYQGADNADLCLVRSQFMAKELSSFSHPKKIIRNPLPYLPSEIKQHIDLRKEHQLENKKIILYVGRISAHKNLGVVLEALKLLLQHNLVFVVVGNYQHRSLKAEKERLVEKARDLRIPHQIIFTGEVSEQELISWFRTCDFYIISSLHEGFCWPLLRAMAQKKPILASRYGAIPETVGEAALFFDAKNPNDLKEKILKLLGDQKLRNSLIQAGVEKVKEYSFDRYRKELLEAVS